MCVQRSNGRVSRILGSAVPSLGEYSGPERRQQTVGLAFGLHLVELGLAGVDALFGLVEGLLSCLLCLIKESSHATNLHARKG